MYVPMGPQVSEYHIASLKPGTHRDEERV